MNNSLRLRKATETDIETLFCWANDKTARENAFDSHTISFDEHTAWFNRMMADPNEIQYMLVMNDESIGQIRLSIKKNEAEVDYSISKSVRGCGYGKEIIRLVIKQVKIDYPYIEKLIARVKPSNVASYYCFYKNGFEETYQQLEYDLRKSESTELEQTFGGGVKILFLTNNRNTVPLYEWIAERCHAEIYSGRLTAAYLKELNPELIISYNYIYVISQECIDTVHENIINMHISLLPWNRGFSPNIWSFIDDTPKGVTIHMLSAGLDEGDILFQEKAYFDLKNETFKSTYTKLNDQITNLFKRNWSIISSGQYKELRRGQKGDGSYHTIADLKSLKESITFEWEDNISDFLIRYGRKCR